MTCVCLCSRKDRNYVPEPCLQWVEREQVLILNNLKNNNLHKNASNPNIRFEAFLLIISKNQCSANRFKRRLSGQCLMLKSSKVALKPCPSGDATIMPIVNLFPSKFHSSGWLNYCNCFIMSSSFFF